MSKKIKLKNLLEENFSTIGGVVSRPTFTNNISLSQMVKIQRVTCFITIKKITKLTILMM